jgi:hypothetical protein
MTNLQMEPCFKTGRDVQTPWHIGIAGSICMADIIAVHG